MDYVDTDTRKGGVVDIDLNYRILDATLDATMCTMGDCHESIDATTGLCSCKTLGLMTRENREEGTARKAARAAAPAASAAPTSTGIDNFLTEMGINKKTHVCNFVTIGKCYATVEGRNCGFLHPTTLDLKSIQCKCVRAKSTPTICKNSPKCLYSHKYLRTPKTLEFKAAVAKFLGA